MVPRSSQAAVAPQVFIVKVHDAKNNEAHGAMNKERHVCARRRGGEPASVLNCLRTGARR